MCTVHHQIRHSTLDFTGELDNVGIPITIINISRTDNESPFNLRNTTAYFRNMKMTHNRDGITIQEYNNIGRSNFYNCIFYRYGSGVLVAAGNGGFIRFEGYLFFFIYTYIFFFFCVAFVEC
jgi:hypothetical protein